MVVGSFWLLVSSKINAKENPRETYGFARAFLLNLLLASVPTIGWGCQQVGVCACFYSEGLDWAFGGLFARPH